MTRRSHAKGMGQGTSTFKAHCIKAAGWTALVGNALLAALKLLFSHLSGSLAVAADAVDSLSDVLIALSTLLVAHVIQLPSDEGHPWGHERAETTATMAFSFAIFFAGSQMVITGVKRIVQGGYTQSVSSLAIVACVVSIAGKILLSLIQLHYARLADSEILKANALNMKSDVLLSSSVLIGLALSKAFGAPVLDPIVAAVVGLVVVKTAAGLFMRANDELMDSSPGRLLYEKLFRAASSVPGVSNPHRARIRRMSSFFDVDLDIEVSPSLSLYEAHEISERVEAAVRKEIPEIYGIVIHVEPTGSAGHQRIEEFGLSPQDLDEMSG